MARIRSIHPGVFTDEAFASLSMSARVLLFGVWTEADDHGVFEWKPVTFKMRIMPVDDVSIPDLLAECERADVIKRFSSGKSYGLVRNFCRYQRPKKPKYIHPMPSEFYLYAGLKPDGSLQVLHQSRTGGESGPQREDGGGEGEEESGSGIEKGEGVGLARADLKLVEEGQPIPINESYQPSDRAIEYAYSLGMKKADLNSELSKFIALSMASRAKSYNPDMSFKAFCDRWLDFKRNKDPNWKPAPEAAAAAAAPQEPFVLVVYGTIEAAAWDHYLRSKGLRPLFFCKHIVDGVEVVAARCPTLVPPGYDEATGEKMAPANEEDAA
jgi:hypothetical protein